MNDRSFGGLALAGGRVSLEYIDYHAFPPCYLHPESKLMSFQSNPAHWRMIDAYYVGCQES